MGTKSTVWRPRPAGVAGAVAGESAGGPVLPVWMGTGLLVLASGVLLALAGASAWLSYHAQVGYVLAHNGGQWEQARVWALLLDAGTAGLSLLRLYETLRDRRGVATRVSLVGCIAASVVMNLLHAAVRTPGGCLVAAVPPVMYAVFLEHLLANLRSVLIGDEKRRGVWRTVVLWLNFPAVMWRVRRGCLRREAEGLLAAPDLGASCSSMLTRPGVTTADEVEQSGDGANAPEKQPVHRYARRGRGLGAKRIAFEAALAQQARSGDLRLFSGDERERNAAAYQAAASLPVPLSRGAARRYVVQALPRLEVFWPTGCALGGVVAPDAGS